MSRLVDRTYLESRWGTDRVAAIAATAVGADADPGDADASVEAAIATAESQALSYLTSRYADGDLPSTPETTPSVLKQNVADLAIYDLERSFQMPADDVVRARLDAISWLKSVSVGRADLGLSAAPPSDSSRPDVLLSKTKADLVFAGPRGIDAW